MYVYDQTNGIIENTEGVSENIAPSQAAFFSDNFLYYIKKDAIYEYNITQKSTKEILKLDYQNYNQLGILGRSFIIFNGHDLSVYTHLIGTKYIHSTLQHIKLPVKQIITDFNTLYVVPKYYTHIYTYNLRKE